MFRGPGVRWWVALVVIVGGLVIGMALLFGAVVLAR
jgi:hypothetical protein